MDVRVIIFVIFAIAAVAGAISMVLARNPVHSAFGLLMTMFAIAVFYIMNGAHFVAALQIMIYAGAVMTLFLFVIMLVGVDTSDEAEEHIPYQRPLAMILGSGLLILIVASGIQTWVNAAAQTGRGSLGTIENVSDELFGTWLLPFEATIFLLTIAAVGTIGLAQFAFNLRVAPGDDDE
ncbi:NADH-ubiquinone oxidoreductase chain J [hydrothermal vent metagenome]|jgi:NADH-quinone oxidoreductase subunit J|uniref:NADH-ubiquinone oxidoreductase chain J n=1 Tax=hydrothermal vent metagenome TaxID=652676 RepID=A0A3B0SML9_9ZZZZ